MHTRPSTALPDRRSALAAGAALVLLLILAFAAASWTQDQALFSLSPAPGAPADMRPDQRLDLHRTFFTIWVALLLVVPALALFPFRGRSLPAARHWLAFWTASLLAFLVHFYWAVVVIFGNDWQRVLHTPRVTAPRLDTVFAAWWVADVLIAWLWRSEAAWVRVQRIGVHVLAFVLFFVGAAREGELALSRGLGLALGIAVGASLLLWLARLRGPRSAQNALHAARRPVPDPITPRAPDQQR